MTASKLLYSNLKEAASSDAASSDASGVNGVAASAMEAVAADAVVADAAAVADAADASDADAMAVLRLRPHHLLCLQTFVGHGYSDEFVAHMTHVQKQLVADPHTPIALVDGSDDLCRHCPNCVGGQCTSEKPALFDRLAAARLPQQKGIGTPYSLSGIPESLHISEELLAACCPGCEWKELCVRVCQTLQ